MYPDIQNDYQCLYLPATIVEYRSLMNFGTSRRVELASSRRKGIIFCFGNEMEQTGTSNLKRLPS